MHPHTSEAPLLNQSGPRPEFSVKAGVVLSRPPLLTRPLTSFEKSYFFYQRRLNERLAMPFTRYFYFKPDTVQDNDWKLKAKDRNGAAARDLGGYNAYGREGWNDEVLVGDQVSEPKTIVEALVRDAQIRHVEEGEGSLATPEAMETEAQNEMPLERYTEADEKNDTKRLDRKLVRTLYLVVKRENGGWGFPSAALIGRENLHQVPYAARHTYMYRKTDNVLGCRARSCPDRWCQHEHLGCRQRAHRPPRHQATIRQGRFDRDNG